jgi:UDP-glucose 4-epimerase
VVYLSSIAFYDWSSGAEMGEDGALATPTAYAKSKLDGEMLCRVSGLDWRAARLGTVFGAGDRANFAKLAGAMARHRFVVPGAGTAQKSVLPVTLAAELLVDLALRNDLADRLVNLALPEAPTLADICRTFSRVCGFPPAPTVPLPILRIGALAGDIIDRVKPGFALTSVNVRKLTQSTVVKTDRMQRLWPTRTWPTFDEELSQAAEHYRSL